MYRALRLLLLAGCVSTNSSRVASFERDVDELRRALFIPGMSAVIVQDQEILWTRGFGYADVENRVPATPDTLYHIASVTKTFGSTWRCSSWKRVSSRSTSRSRNSRCQSTRRRSPTSGCRRKEVAVDETLLATYAGEYQRSETRTYTVTREGMHMFIDIPRGDRTEMDPFSENEFFFKVATATVVKFIREDGAVTELEFDFADGKPVRAKKIR